MKNEALNNRVFFIGVIAFFAICLFLYFARGIIAPFLIAAFLTYIISPLVVKVQSYGYKRWVGVAVLAILFITFLTLALIIFIPLLLEEIDRFKVNVPAYYKYLSNYAEMIKVKVEAAIPIIKEYKVSDVAITKIQNAAQSQAQKIPDYIVNIFSMVSVIVLTPVLVFFMLLGGRRSINMIVEIAPSAAVETVLSVIYEMDSVLGKFIRGQLIEASFVGIMSVCALTVLGVNYALIIGITAGFANMIPYMGPFVGLSFAAIVGLIQFQSAIAVIKIIAVFAVIQFLDNNLVQPFVVGRNVNLGPVTMIFAMLAGAQVFGFLGIVFAVPVAAIIKTIFFMLFTKHRRAVSAV
ncbi:MAG: AI-2E family transporter [Endomicrobium sp.]|jgi:predicted PurR-regulated permease PerM|nr:AI-2E family transporter [Endomicrobium sp.]